MTDSKFLTLLIAVLACGLIAVGCGDDDDSGSSAETTTEESTSSDSSSESSESSDDTASTIDEGVQQCIDAAENSGLEGDQLESAKSLCESAGDAAKNAEDLVEELPSQSQEQLKEICEQAADAIPDESARETAKQACDDQF